MGAHGRKRWFLEPPGQGNYSVKDVLAWLRDDYEDWSATNGGLECVQEAGDILFLPADWGHQTLNIETGIGLAHEYNEAGVTRVPNYGWTDYGKKMSQDTDAEEPLIF